FPSPRVVAVSDPNYKGQLGIAAIGETDGVELRVESGIVYALIPRHREARRMAFVYRRTPDPKAITALVTAGEQLWSEWFSAARRAAVERPDPDTLRDGLLVTKLER